MYIIALIDSRTGEILKYWSGRNWLKRTKDREAKEYITLEDASSVMLKMDKRVSELKFPGDHIDKNAIMKVTTIDVAAERIENKEW